MANKYAKKVYGREILFFEGINYEWDEHQKKYVSSKGEERALEEEELDAALKESGFHPDSEDYDNEDENNWNFVQNF